MCVYNMPVQRPTRLRTKVQIKVVCRKSQGTELCYKATWASHVRDQMQKDFIAKNEVANPSLQKRLQNAALCNQRSYIGLNSCFMCTYTLTQVWCHTPLGHQATRCHSVLFPKKLKNLTAVFLVFHVARQLLACHCIMTPDSDWGSASSISSTLVQPRMQIEWGEQYYCKKEDVPRLGLGCREVVDFCLFVGLFGIGRFHCGVVLLFLAY